MKTAAQINLVDPDVYEHGGPPHEQFAWLREHAPVFWHEYGGAVGWPGFWAITRHEDVIQVSRHPEIFSSAQRSTAFREVPDKIVERRRLMILDMDPPRHTRQRGLVNRGFTPADDRATGGAHHPGLRRPVRQGRAARPGGLRDRRCRAAASRGDLRARRGTARRPRAAV